MNRLFSVYGSIILYLSLLALFTKVHGLKKTLRQAVPMKLILKMLFLTTMLFIIWLYFVHKKSAFF
jgi:hypothetical protein